ncbi:formyltransferase family protein [bacterium]|nr:formyltransferase family protein [bacterium]
MKNKRILIVGTRTWELTSVHMKYFVEEGANIVGVIESPTDKITSSTTGGSKSKSLNEWVEELGIPSIMSGDPKSKEVHEWVKSLQPDIIVVIGYQFLLPKAFLELAPLGVVNFHTSLLPRHCGKHPGFWSIWYGDRYSGMTIHQMDDGLDTGQVLYYNMVSIKNGDTVDSLYERIWKEDEKLVAKFLEDLDSDEGLGKCIDFDRLDEQDQDYSYNYTPSKEDYELDFRYDAQTNANRCSMKPREFYVRSKSGEKVHPLTYRVISEVGNSRNFKIGEPYLYEDSIAYVTPNKLFVIDSFLLFGEPFTGNGWCKSHGAKRIK